MILQAMFVVMGTLFVVKMANASYCIRGVMVRKTVEMVRMRYIVVRIFFMFASVVMFILYL